MDDKGEMLEETACDNTLADTKEFAGRTKSEYGRKGQCCAACETMGNKFQITLKIKIIFGIEISFSKILKYFHDKLDA